MSDDGFVEFEGLVEPLEWGRSTYTILRLDPRVEAAAADLGTRRLEGTIDGVDVNVGLNRADVVAEAFMYVGKSMQRRIDARPGDVVLCRLRPADPDLVPVPDDVRAALDGADRLASFEARTAPERRRLLHPIEEARTDATRTRRITALVLSLG